MSFGGGSRNSAAMQQQLQLMQLQQQAQRNSQANEAFYAELAARQRATAMQQQEAGAQRKMQQRVNLSLFDAVKTSAAGLLNEPSTGRLTLLGN